MRTKFVGQLMAVAFGVVVFAGASAQKAPVPGPVLSRLDSYEPPTFPANDKFDREVYDYRIRTAKPDVPPSLPETFACDVFAIARTLDLRGLSVGSASESPVRTVIGVYIDRPWTQIVGYRPWTYSNFVRSLTEVDRARLVREVVAYARARGTLVCP
jgi:hypothetical protein